MRSDSRSRSLAIAILGFAAAAVASVAIATRAVADAVAAPGRAVASALRFAHAYVRDIVLPAFAEPTLRDLPKPASQLVQACAYALRLAKRERPVIRSTWRMCPSA